MDVVAPPFIESKHDVERSARTVSLDGNCSAIDLVQAGREGARGHRYVGDAALEKYRQHRLGRAPASLRCLIELSEQLAQPRNVRAPSHVARPQLPRAMMIRLAFVELTLPSNGASNRGLPSIQIRLAAAAVIAVRFVY